MEKQLISRVETITPVLAEEYLKHNTKNRQVRQNLVDFYAEQMAKGNWMLNGESVIFASDGTLVDGQHRLRAVIKANQIKPGTEIAMLVVRNVASESFATIDSGATRKIADTFYVKGIPNATHVASIIKKYLTLRDTNQTVVSGNYTVVAKSASRQDLLMEYSQDEEFWQDVVKFSGSCYSALRVMNVSEIGGYVAYLIKAKKHDTSVVYGFFEDLLRTDIPKSKMLAAFRRRLVLDKNSTTHMRGLYKQQLMVKIWNLYIEGKETTCIRWIQETEGKKDFI